MIMLPVMLFFVKIRLPVTYKASEFFLVFAFFGAFEITIYVKQADIVSNVL